MDKRAYAELLEKLAHEGDLEAPAGVRVARVGDGLKVVVQPTVAARVALVLLWLGGSGYLAYLAIRQGLDQLRLDDPVTGGAVVLGLAGSLMVLFLLVKKKTITLDRQYFRMEDRPFASLRKAKVPLLDIRVVDIEAIEKEQRSRHGWERRSTWTYIVTLARTSSYRPVTVYTGSSEEVATFLRHFLSREITRHRAAPDPGRSQRGS